MPRLQQSIFILTQISDGLTMECLLADRTEITVELLLRLSSVSVRLSVVSKRCIVAKR